MRKTAGLIIALASLALSGCGGGPSDVAAPTTGAELLRTSSSQRRVADRASVPSTNGIAGVGVGTGSLSPRLAVGSAATAPPPTQSPIPTPTQTPVGASPIQHVVIVLQENRTFENIFHGFPGANTVNSGTDHLGQTVPLMQNHLMVPWDPAHHYADWNTEYNNGAMNGFDLDRTDFGSGQPANFAYTYSMQSDVQPYWDMATEGSLADEFFADHRSESFSGHMYPIAGASGPISASQPNYYASEDPSGGTCAKQGTAAAVNIVTGKEDGKFTSCFDFQTMADLANAGNKSWRYYVDSASRTTSYVSAYAAINHIYNSPQFNTNVVSPATNVFTDAANGTLANISWVIGTFVDSDHAGQNVPSSNGPNWVASVVNAIGQSPSWSSTAIIFTYDDWGGWFDETAPTQKFNAFDPGFRMPLVIVSPYSRRGYVSHTVHYQGSILHYIESTFGLGSLGTTDSTSDDFSDMFNYQQAPLNYIPIKSIANRQRFFNQLGTNNPPPAPGEDRD